jgi:U-box domain
MNARKNMSTIDLALGEVIRLMQERESLEEQVKALKLEKEALTRQVKSLRKGLPENSTNSLPDLVGAHVDPDDDSMDSTQGLTRSERMARAPSHFICPLTLQIMKHPMREKGTSNNYERGAILEWIYFGAATCPMTRKVLRPTDFVENTTLKAHIERWMQDQNIDDESAHDDLDEGDPVQVLTTEEEREQQARISQQKHSGSDNDLFGLRDRILKQRDDRVRRRLSLTGL